MDNQATIPINTLYNEQKVGQPEFVKLLKVKEIVEPDDQHMSDFRCNHQRRFYELFHDICTTYEDLPGMIKRIHELLQKSKPLLFKPNKSPEYDIAAIKMTYVPDDRIAQQFAHRVEIAKWGAFLLTEINAWWTVEKPKCHPRQAYPSTCVTVCDVARYKRDRHKIWCLLLTEKWHSKPLLFPNQLSNKTRLDNLMYLQVSSDPLDLCNAADILLVTGKDIDSFRHYQEALRAFGVIHGVNPFDRQHSPVEVCRLYHRIHHGLEHYHNRFYALSGLWDCWAQNVGFKTRALDLISTSPS